MGVKQCACFYANCSRVYGVFAIYINVRRQREKHLLEQLLTSLLVADVTGISFIAYKHPAGYQKIDPILRYGSLIILVCGVIWNVALDSSWIRIHSFIAEGKDTAATAALNELKVPNLWLFIGCLGVNSYSIFLYYLPDILKTKGSERP